MSQPRYRCVNCDHVFDVGRENGTAGEPRCPKCHRVHDVVPVVDPAGIPWHRRRTVLGAAALLAVVGAGAVVYALRLSSRDGGGASAPTIPAGSRDEIAGLVVRVGDLPGADLLTGKASGGTEARARALGALMARLVETGALRVVDAEAPAELAERELLDPVPLLQRIGPAAPTVTSLEAALLLLRLARAAGLAAEVVRVERYGAAKAPADPSGLFGHYAVVVHAEPDLVLDPTLPGGVAAEPATMQPVSDAACGGILEAFRALREFLPRPDRPAPSRMAAADHLQKAKTLAPEAAPVRMTDALTSITEEPGKAFAQADAILRAAAPSEKVAVAELYVGLGRTAEVEDILDEVEAVYPAWARIPLVRAQLALFRAGTLAMAEAARRYADMVPPERLDQIRRQLVALGVSESDRADEQFAILRGHLEEAERRGGSRGTAKLRELSAVAMSDHRLTSGDIAGARRALQDAARANPSSVTVAVPLAAILLAGDDEAAARATLEPVAGPQGSLEDLLAAARSLSSRIRAQVRAVQALPRAFDLAAPTGPLPSTEPSLQMPNLGGGDRGGGLGQGLQLRF